MKDPKTHMLNLNLRFENKLDVSQGGISSNWLSDKPG